MRDASAMSARSAGFQTCPPFALSHPVVQAAWGEKSRVPSTGVPQVLRRMGRVADFQIGAVRQQSKHAGWETCGTSDLEVCAAPSERGCVEDQPQRVATFGAAAVGAPFPRTQPRSVCKPVWLLFFLFPFAVFLLAPLPVRADDVGDISADASAIYTGNTFHGYAEIRVDLQNRSHDKSHTVTLIFPGTSYDIYGNSIRRLSRTVTLAPESLQTVSLLRPPLPSRGDGSVHVEVDDGHEGDIHAPNANSHCDYYTRSDLPATVFISRSLDDNAVEHLFNANQSAFTAAMATGPPDATSFGPQPVTWMPDTRLYRQTNWLELDYATPQPVHKIVVYNTQMRRLQGSVTLIGVQGTKIAEIPMNSGRQSRGSAGWLEEYDVKTTTAPVKTVRLEFGKSIAYNTAIDAVQISGPSGSQWASNARASSDNSAMAGAYGGTRSEDPVESLRAETAVTDWSETWLAYSPFDAVVLGQADLASMSPAVFDAIGNYLNAGGNLVLFGATDLPASWHPWTKDKIDGGAEFRIGFGRCFLFDSESPDALDRNTIQTLRTSIRESATYWQSLPQDNASAEAALPVHENIKVPVRGTVIVMLSFVLMIGPVNLILLNRLKRRIWILWTVPAISFASTMLVFIYSLLREGITPDTRICGITVLDQISHHAATFGGESFYCPLTPGGGLKFDYDTEATPLVAVDNFRASGISRDLDWSQTQHLTHGWVSARVPAYFHLRRSGTSRERIEVSNENGSLQIVNGLGAPIRSLWLADANMNFYQVNDVPAGQKTGLIPAKRTHSLDKSGPEGLRRDLGYNANGANDLDSTAQSYLMPNTYIAVLDGNPFVEDALTSDPNLKHTKSVAVVYGILENSDK